MLEVDTCVRTHSSLLHLRYLFSKPNKVPQKIKARRVVQLRKVAARTPAAADVPDPALKLLQEPHCFSITSLPAIHRAGSKHYLGLDAPICKLVPRAKG